MVLIHQRRNPPDNSFPTAQLFFLGKLSSHIMFLLCLWNAEMKFAHGLQSTNELSQQYVEYRSPSP